MFVKVMHCLHSLPWADIKDINNNEMEYPPLQSAGLYVLNKQEFYQNNWKIQLKDGCVKVNHTDFKISLGYP